MKKYFMQRNASIASSIIQDQIDAYRTTVVIEMEKMGATNQEISLLRTETVLNSIRNHRKPEDVAWAILQ